MPLDTSIPLQVQVPQLEDYSQLAAQTQMNALRSQAMQQEMQQNALRMQYAQEDRARAEAGRRQAAADKAAEKALRARILQESGGDAAKASEIALRLGRPDIAESYAKGRESIAKAGESEADLEKKAFTNAYTELSAYAPMIANGAVQGRAVVGAMFNHPVMGKVLSKVMTPDEAMTFADQNPQGLAQILATPPDKIYDSLKPPEVKGQLTEAQRLREKRATADDYNMATTALRDIQDVTRTVDKLAGTDLGGVTGYASMVPSMTETSLKAESDIESLKGKMTALAKTLSAASGKLGNLAVAEYQMLRDQIAAFDPYRGEAATKQQLNDIKTTMGRIETSVRDVYSRTYGGEDNPFEQFRELPTEIGAKTKDGANNKSIFDAADAILGGK